MLKENIKKCARAGLLLPVIACSAVALTGCASDPAVNVTAKECAYDFPLLPDNADITVMSDSLAMSIDAHDALYDRHCSNEGE